MKKRKGKSVVITLIALIVICLACGTIGLLENNKPSNSKKPNKDKDYKVAYKYYLDGEEVEEMIEQEYTTSENQGFEGAEEKTPNYMFEKYTCTNNVTGEFDEENWEFNPDLTANTTCRLYFIRTMHEVTFEANNGKLPSGSSEEKLKVELNKEGTINIIPNDGYEYDKVECNNEVLAEYNAETRDLKVSNVKKDSICRIYFKVRSYTAEAKASNGTVTEDKKSSNYGGTVIFNVKPAENYKYESVTCTNGQNGIYNEVNETLTISGLSNDTVCTVNFKAQKLSVTLNIENGKIKNGYTTTVEVAEGMTATFAIEANEGYVLTGMDVTCGNTKIEHQGQGIIKVYDVKENATCKATLKKAN